MYMCIIELYIYKMYSVCEVCKAIVRDLKELEKVFFLFLCSSELTYNH